MGLPAKRLGLARLSSKMMVRSGQFAFGAHAVEKNTRYSKSVAREVKIVPTHEILERFIGRVESNEHDKAIAEFYTENASMQENQAEPRRGRDKLVAHERAVLARAKSVTSECVRPIFVSGDRVVIRWKFHFVWLDGTSTQMEEIAYERWEGDQIAEEQFFYDPAQRTPK
jgi:ketosteroid isomerase-like protein